MSVSLRDFSGYPGTRISSVYTGTSVSEHGIVGEQWYNHLKERFDGKTSFKDVNSLTDAQNYKMARTLGDYLKSFYGPEAKVAALSINSPWMVHTLGYNSDYFFTFNPENGAFYETFNFSEASWINEFNSRYSTANYLTRQWGPRNDITSYIEYQYINEEQRSNFRTFLYDMNDNGTFRKISASPYINSLMRDFTVAFLVNSKFGQDDIPDLLSVNFTTRPFVENNNAILPAEKEDMIIRLDEDIASLIDFLDIEYGRDNYLITLTSGASSALDVSTSGKKGVTTGYFENNKTMALLNLYLMALHGQARWVLGINDGMIFLNRTLIEKEGLSIKDFQDEAALFMLEVSGIAKAVPLYDYILNNHCDETINKNMFPKRTGDIYISLFPGWQSTVTELGSRQTGMQGFHNIPFIFFGWNTEHGAWLENIDATNMFPLFMNAIGLSHPNIMDTERIRVFK